jgi:hypothetical protein|nr:MAG TPA: antitoxin [Caudoviricetes sp.]
MQQLAQNNLFTAFNNIEKIKEERKVKPVIRVEEMIKTIKEHYNLNAPMLANNLGVDVQAIYRWEKGGRPNIKRYNKIKELYEEIIRENKTEVLEQPETANKEIVEDITAGTPFITLTGVGNSGKFIINANRINKMKFYLTCTEIHINEEYIRVKESPAEIFELIRKNSK